MNVQQYYRVPKNVVPPGPDPTAFIYTVNTANTLTGSSANNQIRLLLFGVGMDFTVDWGDGTSDYITSSTLVTHTYPAPGIYDITWTGANLLGFRVSNNTDRNKFIDVKQWGDLQISVPGAFDRCANLDVTATDLPNFTSTTGIAGMFRGCTSLIGNPTFADWDVSNQTSFQFTFGGSILFNQNISSWDVSNVNNYANCFDGCTLFNQPIGSWSLNTTNTSLPDCFRNTAMNQDLSAWNVIGVSNFNRTFSGCTFSTANYDALLISWAAQAVKSSVLFHAGGSKYTNSGAALAARNTLTGTYGWTITDGGPA